MPELEEVMTMDQATDEVHWWARRPVGDRDVAFDVLLGWVAGRAIIGDPHAVDTLRRARERAERP